MERSLGIDLNADEEARRHVLTHSTVIAVVGRSKDPMITSYGVGQYLIEVGYTVYSVNPMVDEIDGAPSYDSLADVPEPVDIVDVFRKADYLPEIVDEAIAIGAKTVWAQLDIVSDEARQKALAAGLNYADDICIRAEHRRLFRNMVEG